MKTARLRQNITLQSFFANAAGVFAYSETGSENKTEISVYRITYRSYYTLQPGILPPYITLQRLFTDAAGVSLSSLKKIEEEIKSFDSFLRILLT